mgnify:CR=1 FL=1
MATTFENLDTNEIVTLPSPEMGDSLGDDFRLIEKRTLDGELHTYICKSVIDLLEFSFIVRERSEIYAFQTFIRNLNGAKVEIIDHDSIVFQGDLITPIDTKGMPGARTSLTITLKVG